MKIAYSWAPWTSSVFNLQIGKCISPILLPLYSSILVEITLTEWKKDRKRGRHWERCSWVKAWRMRDYIKTHSLRIPRSILVVFLSSNQSTPPTWVVPSCHSSAPRANQKIALSPEGQWDGSVSKGAGVDYVGHCSFMPLCWKRNLTHCV